MPYTKENIVTLYNLTAEEVDRGISSAGLPLDQSEYTDEEVEEKFKPVAAELFPQVFAVTQEAESNGQAKGKKTSRGKKAGKTMSRMEVLKEASEQVGGSISFMEAGKLLEACGLGEQEEYSAEEVQCFLKACELHKTQGKSLAEVAAHFGVATGSHEEVLQLLEQMSGDQIEELKASLIQAKQQQNQEFIEAFHRMTIQKLRQKAESGELQADLQQAWTGQPVGNGFNLLAQVEARMESQKRLPGS